MDRTDRENAAICCRSTGGQIVGTGSKRIAALLAFRQSEFHHRGCAPRTAGRTRDRGNVFAEFSGIGVRRWTERGRTQVGPAEIAPATPILRRFRRRPVPWLERSAIVDRDQWTPLAENASPRRKFMGGRAAGTSLTSCHVRPTDLDAKYVLREIWSAHPCCTYREVEIVRCGGICCSR
jgi:hypothetical protein